MSRRFDPGRGLQKIFVETSSNYIRMEYQVHKIAEWIGPICRRYEDWLISQGRVEEAQELTKTINEHNKIYFCDWNSSPFEARVACRQIWMDAFMVMVQGLGYPNLLDVGYANDL